MAARLLKKALAGLVLGVLGVLALGSWALASPVGAAPDDDFHMVSIWCSWGEREGLCEQADNPDERIVEAQLSRTQDCYVGSDEQSAVCDLPDDHYEVTKRGNFLGAYPPVFYATLGTLASTDIPTSIILMRLLNAVIFVGAVGAVVALSRPGRRGPVLWAAAVGMIPLGMFIVPSVNPSSWAVLAGLTTWAAMTGYLEATTRGRLIALGALAVLIGLMGAGARGDAAIYVSFAALAAGVLTFEKSRRWMKRAILPAALIALAAVSFLTSKQSTWAASTGVTQGASAERGSSLGLLLRNFVDLPWLWSGGMGTWNLGWLEVGTPITSTVLVIACFGLVVFGGLRLLNWRKSVVLLMAALALIVIPLYVLYGVQAGVGAEVQPRYLLPLILTFAALALTGYQDDAVGLNRVQGLFVLGAMTLANALTLHVTMRRYITGIDFKSMNLNEAREWWWNIPIEPMTVWLTGSLAFGLLMLAFYAILFRGKPGLLQTLGFTRAGSTESSFAEVGSSKLEG